MPEDIAVGGFDGIAETKIYATPITTAGVPIYEMGAEAVILIDDVNHGKPREKRKLFNLELIVNESCGCMKHDKEEIIKERMNFFDQTERRDLDNFRTTYMTIDLESVTSLKQMVSVIGNHAWCLGSYTSFHLCLCQGIYENQIERQKEYTDEMQLYLSAERDKELQMPGDMFPKDYLLPESVISEEPQIFYFLPLHFKENCFGYTAISFELGGAYEDNYQTWMVNLGNAIEDIFIRKRMQQLIDNLENLYIRDELTGLYNRRGFEKFGEEMFEKAKEKGRYVYMIGLDLDGLKTINDTYGHAHGDIAIKAIAEAIKHAAGNSEICARMGGDEYSVLGIADENAEKYANEFIRLFNEQVEAFNNKYMAEYTLGASYGTSIGNLEQDSELEFFMNQSDDAMYLMKASRKGRR